MINRKQLPPVRKHPHACRHGIPYLARLVFNIPSKLSNGIYPSIFLIAIALFGCLTTRPMITPRDPLKQLQNSINSILSDSIFLSTNASIKIVSIDSGKVLYEHESKALMNPASNIKLITSAAALSMLDTGYQFKTSIYVNDNEINGHIVQNIYLKGFGDPDLTTADLDSLAFAVRGFGIKTIVNNIIVDDSFFDDNYWGDGWAWDDESDPDAPYINALSVNKNCICVNVIADSNNTIVSLEPNTDFVIVVNNASIVLDSINVPLKIKRLTLNNTNTILVEGEISRYSQVTQKVSLRHPELYAGMLFKESLRRAGVFMSGNIVRGVVPDGIHEIARHFLSIETVVTNMNKISDNLSAENILKVIAALTYNVPGSAKNGVYAEKRFLSGLGIDTTKLSIADGSGVSRYNLLSADQLIQFLAAMKKQPRLFSIFYNSLPVAGIDGTLANRMSSYPVACNLRAKTGTLNGVSCLAGYVQTFDHEMLAFSMMMQNFITPVSDYRQAQDRIGTLLAGFRRTIDTQKGSTK